MDLLRYLNVLFCIEMGQVLADMLVIIDMVFCQVIESSIYILGVLLIFTMDHNKIKPTEGSPFLTLVHMISCFKIFSLKKSVIMNPDEQPNKIQQILRHHH